VDGKPVAGTELSPAVMEIAFSVLPPANFPTVGASVDFGTLGGTTTATAPLTVTGPGCVWIVPGSATVDTAPEAAGAVTVGSPNMSPETCLELAAGETGQLSVTLQTQATDNGLVSGTVPVTLASTEDQTLTRTMPVTFTGEMKKPLNVPSFWATLISALILGPGLPLALLYLLKFLLNSKIPSGLNYALLDVKASDGDLQGADGALRLTPIRMLDVKRGGQRQVGVDDLEVSSRFGWSPITPATAQVTAPGVTSAAPGAQPGSKPARLPLALANKWVVLKSAGSAVGAARVLMFFSQYAEPVDRQRVLDNVQADAPRLIAALEGAEGGTAEGGHASRRGRGHGTDAPASTRVAGDMSDPFGSGVDPFISGADPFRSGDDPFGTTSGGSKASDSPFGD